MLGSLFFGVPAKGSAPSTEVAFEPARSEEGVTFGPFPGRDLEKLDALLEQKQIRRRWIVDPEKYESEKRAQVDTALAFDYLFVKTFDPRFVYLILESEDLPKIDSDLERYGIVKP